MGLARPSIRGKIGAVMGVRGWVRGTTTGLVAAVVGCGGNPASGGASNMETSTDTDSGIVLSDTGDKLDVAEPTTTSGMMSGAGDEAGNAGCEKVDFVFVIDSSLSMEDEQGNLINSFPGFIHAIEDELDVDDFHLMVVDAGDPDGPGCDGTLGVGQVESADGMDCGLSGDARYATQTQSDLVDAFTCMASRGIDGSLNEQTMQALVNAIGPLNEPGECNEGFLRDDAILVVTLITDEEDDPDDRSGGPLNGECAPIDDDENSDGDPQAWHDAVLAAKGGNADAIVVLGLIGDCDEDGMCPGFAFGPDGITGAEPAPRVREFVQSFPRGSIGPVCAPDYAPFFTAAVGAIQSACEDFMPVG